MKIKIKKLESLVLSVFVNKIKKHANQQHKKYKIKT